MIVRVKIRNKVGKILRQWALHRTESSVTLTQLKQSMFDGSSGNECFPSLQPAYIQHARTSAVCGMTMSDLIETPMDFCTH